MTFDELCESDLAALASGEFGATATLTGKGGAETGSVSIVVGDEQSGMEDREAGQVQSKRVMALASRADLAGVLGRDVAEEDLLTIGTRTWAVVGVELDGWTVRLELEAVVEVSKVKGERVARR